MSLLTVDNLTKSFGGLKVLTGVTFDLSTGEKLALIGPNGAGKSTLINAIGGQGPATSGSVVFNGTQISHLSPNKRLRLGLGRSYQANNLLWQLTVINNTLISLYGAEKMHFNILQTLEKRKDLREDAEELLSAVGLWDKRHEFPSTLSYGEQRLLELLMAFTSKPKLVLLDEPSAGFPTAEAVAFAGIIRRLSKADTAVLFCAHDMDLVFELADTIMVLYFGKIIARGSPSEIAANPKVQEIYLGGADES